jgi:hypothetical protein
VGIWVGWLWGFDRHADLDAEMQACRDAGVL